MNTTSRSQRIAEALLKVKAVKLQPDAPFTWASGWKSPIYCDNRVTLSYPEVRSLIKTELAAAIREEFGEPEVIAGVATGAIAQGALVADLLGLPFVYVRPAAKDHGMGNQIEGELPPASRVLVIEDLISTGGSSLKAVEALRRAGSEVLCASWSAAPRRRSSSPPTSPRSISRSGYSSSSLPPETRASASRYAPTSTSSSRR